MLVEGMLDFGFAKLNFSANGRVVTVIFTDGTWHSYYMSGYYACTDGVWVDAEPYSRRRLAESN